MTKPDDDPAEIEAAWATEVGRRLQGIVDGTAVGVPDSEVRSRFRALRNQFITESSAECEDFSDTEVAEALAEARATPDPPAGTTKPRGA